MNNKNKNMIMIITSRACRNPIFEYQSSWNLINACQELNFFIFKWGVFPIITAFYLPLFKSDYLVERISSQKNDSICAFLPIITSRRNALLEKSSNYWPSLHLQTIVWYRVISYQLPKSREIMYGTKKKYRSGVVVVTSLVASPDRKKRDHRVGL